mmetsp:Transcript_30477/g.77757  ORF Transcript_30477/g.77757 Transcript_30477/m.77757 type:complete len:217 (+) Transcript_30477:141-791(+)
MPIQPPHYASAVHQQGKHWLPFCHAGRLLYWLRGNALASSQLVMSSWDADCTSRNQRRRPCEGRTSCAGSAPGSDCTSSTRCTISALSSPDATSTTSLAALMTGSVMVMRSGGGLGELVTGSTQPADAGALVAARLGNSDATWPSGPMPSRMRSNTGRLSRRGSAASGTDSSWPAYCVAACSTGRFSWMARTLAAGMGTLPRNADTAPLYVLSLLE